MSKLNIYLHEEFVCPFICIICPTKWSRTESLKAISKEKDLRPTTTTDDDGELEQNHQVELRKILPFANYIFCTRYENIYFNYLHKNFPISTYFFIIH